VLHNSVLVVLKRQTDGKYYRIDEDGWCCWTDNMLLAQRCEIETAEAILLDMVYNCELVAVTGRQ